MVGDIDLKTWFSNYFHKVAKKPMVPPNQTVQVSTNTNTFSIPYIHKSIIDDKYLMARIRGWSLYFDEDEKQVVFRHDTKKCNKGVPVTTVNDKVLCRQCYTVAPKKLLLTAKMLDPNYLVHLSPLLPPVQFSGEIASKPGSIVPYNPINYNWGTATSNNISVTQTNQTAGNATYTFKTKVY